MGVVFIVNRIEKHEGVYLEKVFDSLDKARAYARGLQWDLEENRPNNVTTTFEIEEWDVL